MADVLDRVVEAIDGLAAVDPSVLADGETLVLMNAQLERLTALLTQAVARFDAGGEWAVDGARSAAAWLATRCRTPKPMALRRVGTARTLRDMPGAKAAWTDGIIGEPQVALLHHAQRTCSEAFARDEEMLVAQAADLQHRTFKQVIAYWEQLNEPDEVERQAERDRDLRRAHLSPGMRGTGFLNARFDPIGYRIFDISLREIEKEMFAADWADARTRLGATFSSHDLRRTPAQRRADALVEMARRARAMPAGARLPEPLFTVLLDLDTAKRVCELDNETVLTPGALAPWLHEAWIERAVLDGPDRTINLGIRRRLFTGGTRRAVQVRYRECYHEFCDVPVDECEIDHIEPYSAGGLTVDTNGRPACGFHNRLRHQRREESSDPGDVQTGVREDAAEPEQPP